MERASGETALIDRTGRMLKMEPLATVESLEQYLLKMVSKPQFILFTEISIYQKYLIFVNFFFRWQSSGMTLTEHHLFLYENYAKARHLCSDTSMILMKMELFTGLEQMQSKI